MKGAIAVPLVIIIKPPKSSRVRMIGSSQNFFLFVINPNKSLRKSNLFPRLVWFFNIFRFEWYVSNAKNRILFSAPFSNTERVRSKQLFN